MKLLLDTGILIWWLQSPEVLKEEARKQIENRINVVYISAATQWEISIKKNLGKLEAPDNLEEIMIEEGFQPVFITFAHAKKAGSLPNHHNDPFDRLLVAQALLEDLVLVTRDRQICKYSASILEG